ncbi:hypothetical protein EWB00_001589 [Schistosoma japonicum]|uniref:Uncharacterized protein n=1 Tax=Schistosoma japonicum TaxID=6182 RepID=A0A4Z2CKN3_SCHJA|nr:hypothetical protein EWB00_001589 [Schistosoma japonicum]
MEAPCLKVMSNSHVKCAVYYRQGTTSRAASSELARSYAKRKEDESQVKHIFDAGAVKEERRSARNKQERMSGRGSAK